MSALSKLLPCLIRNQKYSRIVIKSHFPVQSIAITQLRYFAQGEKSEKALSHARPEAQVSTDVRPLGEKIKETTKTVSYLGVILVGVGVTGIIFYFVFRELFSSSSPNSIYSAALERCIEDPYVSDSLGAPIKGFGEETNRRRRTRVSHLFYMRDGVNCIRMQFYIRGSRTDATVHLDMKEGENGKFEYRYLFVELNDYARRVIVLEDNRAETDKKVAKFPEIQPLPSLQ